MKYIKQISTGNTILRGDPHRDYKVTHNGPGGTIVKASKISGIDISDLEVADEPITTAQFTQKVNDSMSWENKMKRSDRTLTRKDEDHITELHGGDAGTWLQSTYDAKIALRATKPKE